jgi:hypothetical protein
MNSDFDSVGCDSRIRHRTKIGLFLSLDAAVASHTVKITVLVNRPLTDDGELALSRSRTRFSASSLSRLSTCLHHKKKKSLFRRSKKAESGTHLHFDSAAQKCLLYILL